MSALFLQSSDSTIPSAGTDIAYIGAHQAGFARKPPPQAAAPAHPEHARIDYPYGTVADDGAKARAKGPAPQRDIKAAHKVHRQAVAAAAGSAAAAVPKPHAEFSPTFAVKMERAAKRAARGEKSARAEPTSSDLAVPEMGTNVVFQGASAVRAVPAAESQRVIPTASEADARSDRVCVMDVLMLRGSGSNPPPCRPLDQRA